MTILIASNNIDDFGGVTSQVTYVSTAGRFDSDYVDGAIRVADGASSPAIQWPGHGGTDTWVHYEHAADSWGSNQDGFVMQFRDSSANVVARLDLANGDTEVQIFGSGGSTTSGYVDSGPALQSYDWLFNVVGTTLTVDLYINGLNQHGQVSRDLGTFTDPVELILVQNDASNGYYSQFFVSTMDTRGRKLGILRPDSQGNYNSWTGGFNELGDADPLSVAFSDTIGERESSGIDAWAGLTTGSIESVVTTSRSLRSGASGPQSFTQFLRLASTDYDGGSESLGLTAGIYTEEWTVNPNTTNNWVFADLTSLEIGLLSGA